MAAITVAIAATIYFFISEVTAEELVKTPDLSFYKEVIPSKGIRVVRVDTDLDWSDFDVTGLNLTAAPTGTVDAGDFISISAFPGSIQVIYKPTNTLMGNWSWI
jgi:hypothetical protein